MTGALSHIRVLDMSRVLAGPWAGQMFADLGADVIKIERPGRGDDTRAWGPPYLKDTEGRDTSEPGYFLAANRNKRSVTIDITHSKGQELIRGLAALSDVLIENYKVGGLQKYGLDYAALRKVNPGLVYCSITGFGQSGPYAGRPGYDFMIQAMAGLMSITGERDDTARWWTPEGRRRGCRYPHRTLRRQRDPGSAAAPGSDRAGAIHRHGPVRLPAGGAGQPGHELSGVGCTVPGRLGNAHPNIVPYQVFASSDGFLIIAVGNNEQFRRFCRLLEREDLADDPEFSNNRERVHNRDKLVPLLEPLVKLKSTSEWIAVLEAESIPCGPIFDLEQTFRRPTDRGQGDAGGNGPRPCRQGASGGQPVQDVRNAGGVQDAAAAAR